MSPLLAVFQECESCLTPVLLTPLFLSLVWLNFRAVLINVWEEQYEEQPIVVCLFLIISSTGRIHCDPWFRVEIDVDLP